MVFLTEMEGLFWGVTLDSGKRYSQSVESSFHISMAALEPTPKAGDGDQGGFVSVMLQHNDAEFLLCTLQPGKILQVPLNLIFATGEEVTFFLNGKGTVHLTGYLDPLPGIDEDGDSYDEAADVTYELGNEDDSDASSSDDDSDDDEDDEEEDSDEDDDSESEVPQLMGLDSDEDEDDSEEEEEVKMTNGKRKRSLELGNKNKKKKLLLDDEAEEEEDSDEWEELEDVDSDEMEEMEMEEEEVKEESKKSKKKKNKKNKAEKVEESPKAQESPKAAESPASAENGATPNSEKKKKKKKKNKNKDQEGQESESAESPAKTPAGKNQQQAQKTPGSEKKDGKNTPAKNTPAKKMVLSGGVVAEELKEGHGPPATPGKMVGVYYKGTLAKGGKQFDACQQGAPFKFRLGKSEVIKGWDIGVKGMKVGGKRRLTIPANMAYGSQRQGSIPPNSSLVFDVELKNVK